MSVFAYVGLPRSGKTYTAVSQQILPALRQGRLVVTNVPMKRDVVVRDIPDAENLLREFPMAAVVAAPDSIWEHCPNGALVVLDEVWRFWPAGKKVDKIPEAWKSFLAEHGHRVDAAGNAMQVVLITQDLAQIAAFARQLVEQTFRTIKLSSIGFHKKFRTDIYGGPVQGPNPPEAQRLRQIFGTYDPKVYQYYTSHTLSEAGEGGANEKAIDERGNVFLKPAMMALPFLVLGLVWFGWHFLSKSHSQLVGAPASAARGAAVGGVSAAASGAPVAALAQRWWLVRLWRTRGRRREVRGHRDGE